MTGELGTGRDTLAKAACAMGVLGRGSLEELRDLGIACEAADLARAAREMLRPALRCTPGGFEVAEAPMALADVAAPLASHWPDLGLGLARRLCERGEFERAGELLGELLEAVDVRPVVFRHVFDLLNVGQVELVESLVFDEAFGAPEWLREALSTVEGLLWSGFRGYRREARRAREAQAAIGRMYERGAVEGPDALVLVQAWSLIDLYASWGDPIADADELPRDLADVDDGLVRSLWALRRARQLAALGQLDRALPLVEAARSLVAADSVVGAHLACDRLLLRTLLGEVPGDEALAGAHRASRFASDQRLDLLSVAIDGYREAALAFVGSDGATEALFRLRERSAVHPDPLLQGALSIACAADAYRRHSFYAALNYVRDLPLDLGYLGATDLVCAAYVLEVLCQGAVGEEPGPPPEPAPGRPSALGVLPLARSAYGVAQDVYRVVEEIDPEALGTSFGDGEPSFVAARLAALTLGGSWAQALALGRVLPRPWREAAEREAATATTDRPGARERRRRRPAREPAGEEVPEPVSMRPLRLPKLDLRMLGTFEVWVGERRLTEECWRRKAGRTLIQALIVAPGHALTRAELCEALWPDRDYLSSRNSLYSVLSSVREALGCVGLEHGYLSCEEGTVALNPKLMECDVDVFEGRCREVLSHEGDRPWRLSLCRHIGTLYRGGLVVPAQDVRGEFQARRQGLETLYVDLLVEAADLSLKEGLAKEALWFATDACNRSELREDALSCRMRALAADGRARELDAAYKRYCTELSDGLFMAPSARMRTLYANLCRYVRDAAPGVSDRSLAAYEEALDTVA